MAKGRGGLLAVGCRGRGVGARRASSSLSAASNIFFESLSGTRSCGRLGPARLGSTVREVEFDRVGEERIGRLVRAEHPLRLAIRFHERGVRAAAAGEGEIAKRLGIHREESRRRAILGRHVRDRGAVGEREAREARTVELHELADDLLLAEHLRHDEHEIRGRRAGGQFALELEADDLGDEHRERLSEHRCFRFDAADAPAEHAESVHHRGVRIGADERVGVREGRTVLVGGEHRAAEVFEVHLVADAGARRHDGEIAERALAPAEERVALLIALELTRGVDEQRGLDAELVDLHRVIDDEIGGLQRIDLLGIAAELRDGVAHRREIDHGGDAGEILEQHARDAERDLLLDTLRRIPLRERLDVAPFHEGAVLVPEEILEEDFERERQPADRRRVEFREVEERVVLPRDGESRAGMERIQRGHEGSGGYD